jgi:hypothetical protein
MILQTFDFDIPALFNSDNAVAICQSESEPLTNLISMVRHARYGVIVVESDSEDHFVFATTDSTHEGTLIGDTRKWTKEHGYRFWIKRPDERISAPGENDFSLPDGRIVEIHHIYTTAGVFTQLGLSLRAALPAQYVQL